MPKILKCYLQISQNFRFSGVCILLSNRIFSVFQANFCKVIQSILIFLKRCIIQSNYTLQNLSCSKKYFSYTQEVLKSISNIQKSSKKEEKAVIKHSLHLYFFTFSELFLLYSILNSDL